MPKDLLITCDEITETHISLVIILQASDTSYFHPCIKISKGPRSVDQVVALLDHGRVGPGQSEVSQIGGAWRSQTCHQLELFWDTERTSYQFLEKRWHRITINHTSRVPQHTDTKFHAHKNIRIRSIVTMLGMLHTHTQVNECHAGWPYLSPGPEHLYLPCCSNCISTSTSSQVEERTWKRWQETHRLPAFPCSLRTPRPPISPDKSDFSK